MSHRVGDYDGDKGWACWDPRLVAPFVNADLKYLEEPESLGKKFSKDTERVSDFLQRVRNLSIESRILETQKVTLGALRDPSLVGKYSTYHDKAMYIYGYSHPKTIELAYM
jgi:RNA-dependent RNA polymerase